MAAKTYDANYSGECEALPSKYGRIAILSCKYGQQSTGVQVLASKFRRVEGVEINVADWQ
jgi:hypothetical protein